VIADGSIPANGDPASTGPCGEAGRRGPARRCRKRRLRESSSAW
jgi:hypothetical protein